MLASETDRRQAKCSIPHWTCLIFLRSDPRPEIFSVPTRSKLTARDDDGMVAILITLHGLSCPSCPERWTAHGHAAPGCNQRRTPPSTCCCSASGDTNLIWRPISAQPSASTAASSPATGPREDRKYLALDLARNAVYTCTTPLSWPREYPGPWPVRLSGNAKAEQLGLMPYAYTIVARGRGKFYRASRFAVK